MMTGRKAQRYATLGCPTPFLEYLTGEPTDNRAFLPYRSRDMDETAQTTFATAV
ncbi:MAG: hypothetical protein HC923_00970 [Myxococcales bacterium]|nr:hypothetical protein [Myxococcales bacterium]